MEMRLLVKKLSLNMLEERVKEPYKLSMTIRECNWKASFYLGIKEEKRGD